MVRHGPLHVRHLPHNGLMASETKRSALRIAAADLTAGFADGITAPPSDADDPGWRRSLAAADMDGLQLGVVTVSAAPATNSYFFEVMVSPGQRRRGIGTQLAAGAQELLRRTDPAAPLLGRAMPSHPHRERFLRHLGATPFITCPMPRVDATETAVQSWIDGQPIPVVIKLVPLSAVDKVTVAAAWADYFTWAHQPFGQVNTNAVPDTWTSLRDGLDLELSVIAKDSQTGRIRGFSLVRPDVWDGRTFIVCETTHPDDPDAMPILRAALAASLRGLAGRGATRIEIEGHSTDLHLPHLADELPAEFVDSMTIYRWS